MQPLERGDPSAYSAIIYTAASSSPCGCIALSRETQTPSANAFSPLMEAVLSIDKLQQGI